MEYPLDTVIYADESTASVMWLEDDRLVVSPMEADGSFAVGERHEPVFLANDLAAHQKRIEAALHRAAGNVGLAEEADREARFHDGCADRDEANCMGHRELGGVKPAIEESHVVRMTIVPGRNSARAGSPA